MSHSSYGHSRRLDGPVAAPQYRTPNGEVRLVTIVVRSSVLICEGVVVGSSAQPSVAGLTKSEDLTQYFEPLPSFGPIELLRYVSGLRVRVDRFPTFILLNWQPREGELLYCTRSLPLLVYLSKNPSSRWGRLQLLEPTNNFSMDYSGKAGAPSVPVSRCMVLHW